MCWVCGLGVRLLQVRDGMPFWKNDALNNAALQPKTSMSKSLTSVETQYGSIKREALWKTPGPREVPSLHFANEVNMITHHKQLVVIFKKDDESLSHRLQRITLKIHQYNIRILYKPGTQLFLEDLLSRHDHETNRDKEISGIYITINVM